MTAEKVSEDIIGWIDIGSLQYTGQVLYVDGRTIPQYKLQLKLRERLTVLLNKQMKDLQKFVSDKYISIKYNPVYSYCDKRTLSAFKTTLNIPMLDYDLNYIFNLNDEQSDYRKYRSISNKLKHINIIFILDGKQHILSPFPQIVNVLQDLQPLFEYKSDDYYYYFGCLMDFDFQAHPFSPVSKDLNTDYSQLINYLSDMVNNEKNLRAISIRRVWDNINKAFVLIKDDSEATNLFIIIGEKDYSSKEITKEMKDKLVANNCHIIGFQLYSRESIIYNKFVLNIESKINSYSDRMLKTKGDIQVSPNQLCYENYFKENNKSKNGYRLEFPENSITQKNVFFRQKGESFLLEVLTNNVDTTLHQIKKDNSSLIQYMTSAFVIIGNKRTRFDSLFAIHYGLQSQYMPTRNIVSGFKNDLPDWTLPP